MKLMVLKDFFFFFYCVVCSFYERLGGMSSGVRAGMVVLPLSRWLILS